MHQSPAARTSTHATQTSPHISSSLNSAVAVAQAKQGLAASQHAPNGRKQPPPQTAPPKKTRRNAAKEYLIAARQRREQQKWRNDHHPIPREDQWTCEFCEYEQIFGTPPIALIRQYEIKDRQVRKQEAERRRLLEKAKMKGRKGKKGNKTAPKSTIHPQQAQHNQHSAPLNHSQSQSQGTQSEEYYEDEYDEENTQDDPPPPSPAVPPVAHQPKPVFAESSTAAGVGGAGSGDDRARQ